MQSGRAVNALMTATYGGSGRILSSSNMEESGWATKSGLWKSSPEICRQDLAAGFLVPSHFRKSYFSGALDSIPPEAQ